MIPTSPTKLIFDSQKNEMLTRMFTKKTLSWRVATRPITKHTSLKLFFNTPTINAAFHGSGRVGSGRVNSSFISRDGSGGVKDLSISRGSGRVKPTRRKKIRGSDRVSRLDPTRPVSFDLTREKALLHSNDTGECLTRCCRYP